MNKWQFQVREFHRKFGLTIGNKPELRDAELRAKLIEEEAKETVDAIRAGNLVEAIDGLCDLIYVTCGAAEAFGVNLEPFYDEVHRSNMEKTGGKLREDGKLLKPEGWKAPDIEGILDQQIYNE